MTEPTRGKYVPTLIYFEQTEALELVRGDTATIYHEVVGLPGLAIVRNMTTLEPIGFRLHVSKADLLTAIQPPAEPTQRGSEGELPRLLKLYPTPWHTSMDGVKNFQGIWICEAGRFSADLVELANYAGSLQSRFASPVGVSEEQVTAALEAHQAAPYTLPGEDPEGIGSERRWMRDAIQAALSLKGAPEGWQPPTTTQMVRALFIKQKTWSAGDLVAKIPNAPRKEIYNALTYLTRKNELSRGARGLYTAPPDERNRQ